jgi:hypothetical protein
MPGSAPVPLVHLVGSLPLDTAEATFTRISEELPNRLQCMPDGEPTKRGNFVYWQSKAFPVEILYFHFHPPAAQIDKNFELKPDDIKPTGYDDAAIASYSTFCRLRDAGTIPSGVRFQVSLPTPLNAVSVWVDPKYMEAAEIQYEQRILSALANIQAKIPAEDLAIQWDMAVEMAHMEHAYGPTRPDFQLFQPTYSPVKEGIAERISRLVKAIDEKISVGFHLCYGDFKHKHFLEPKDSSLLVDLMNSVAERLTEHHSIGWFHIPVPKDRVDDAYFEPLNRLKIANDTTLFLGLVHANDPEGTGKRVAAAKRALGDRGFGVSTECGLGRTPVEDLDSIFQIFKDSTQQT